jgi:hypothetical protein
VAASIAVAPEGDIYAVTETHVHRIGQTSESSAQIVWTADLSTAFPGYTNVNALTPTITANGVAISVAAALRVDLPGMKKATNLAMKFGVGLLDRDTGRLRYFAEGVEESIAVTSVGPDGSYYTAGSPVRRAVSVGLWGSSLPPLVGGITRYKPVRLDLLARDAACAAAHRCVNAAGWGARHPASVAEARQVRVLTSQALWAWEQHLASARGEEEGEEAPTGAATEAAGAAALRDWLQIADVALPLNSSGVGLENAGQALAAAYPSLKQACAAFP